MVALENHNIHKGWHILNVTFIPVGWFVAIFLVCLEKEIYITIEELLVQTSHGACLVTCWRNKGWEGGKKWITSDIWLAGELKQLLPWTWIVQFFYLTSGLYNIIKFDILIFLKFKYHFHIHSSILLLVDPKSWMKKIQSCIT